MDALRYIARAADGSMRDALSILDECMSASIGQELTKDRVLSVIGAVSVDIYIRMLAAVKDGKPEEVLDIINETIWDGKDLIKFADDFTWFIRNVLFLKLSPKIAGELDMTDENAEELKKLGAEFSVDTLTRYLNILQETCSEIRKSSVKRITLETSIIKMMRPETDFDIDSILSRLDNLERNGVSVPSAPPTVSAENTLSSQEVEALVDAAIGRELSKRMESKPVAYDEGLQSDIITQNIKEEFPPAEADDILRLSKRWNAEIVPKLRTNSMLISL